MNPRVWISSLTFNDKTEVNLQKDDAVIIVGPNGSGKSATLRAISAKLADPDESSPVVAELEMQKEGTYPEVVKWLEATTKSIKGSLGLQFRTYGKSVNRDLVKTLWTDSKRLGSLSDFFCVLLDAEQRLQAANPADSIAIAREGPSHPIHILQWDDSVERRISQQFKRAFGVGIVVHRNAGRKVPILVGEAPETGPEKDRLSIEYVLELEKLQPIETQGDGMRSFLGVLLFTTVGSESVLLIDEPEAFLHPPQARHLADFLVSHSKPGRQLFIATHSGDVLRGILDTENPRVRVLRLRCEGDLNVVSQLNNSQITQLWGDPLLRYSSVLDGLFHEGVVVCESDSDCRFYSAITDAIFESGPGTERKPDVMFTHCGGKARLPLIIHSLRALRHRVNIS